MLYFLGNCQMDFLSRAMSRKGYDCEYRMLASPFTYNSSPGSIPAELRRIKERFNLDQYCHGRTLSNQFEMISSADSKPELIVMNLFHENSPLFVHNDEKFMLYLDPKAWAEFPELESWMKAHFGMIKGNPSTYLKRYREMLEKFLIRFPDVPVILVTRLSHYPAFGPDPYSYLEGWNSLWREASGIFHRWEREFEDVHVVEMDRLFAGIWERSEKKIEEHCPFLKFSLDEHGGRIIGLHASRDVEHIGSMWPVLADKVAGFMETGRIGYELNEAVPEQWWRPWQSERLDRDEMIRLLSSGANYLCARAIGSFFLDLDTDYTDLLVLTSDFLPVCHNTLHMIRTYGRIHRNPALGLWCRKHRLAAEAFIDNGPLYRQDYLKRIDEIERFAFGQEGSPRQVVSGSTAK